jgi:5-methylcytosine-specific restriction endonuclease McrA
MVDVSTKESRHDFYTSTAWRSLRKQALERDHHECVWCASEGRVTTKSHAILEVDHIQELEHHPELALELDNLRTLCKSCHNKRHGRFDGVAENKKKWDDETFSW